MSKALMKPREKLPETALIPLSGALLAWQEAEAETNEKEELIASRLE
jgi:hypothetical protein